MLKITGNVCKLWCIISNIGFKSQLNLPIRRVHIHVP